MSQDANVQTCNKAIRHCGESYTIQSLTEESQAARECRLVFSDARDELLEVQDWGFARRHKLLALSGDTPPTFWLYAYAMPADAQAIRRVYVEGQQLDADDAFPWELGHGDEGERLIYTNVEQAYARYTARVTDAQRFPQPFIELLALRVATLIAMPLTGSRSVLQDVTQLYERKLAQATASDASQSKRRYDSWTPDHIAVRS